MAVAVAAVIWFAVVTPVIAAFSEQADVLVRSEQAAQELRRRTVPLAQLQARRDELKALRAQEPGAMDAPSPAVAGATLQTLARRLVEASGGSLRSMQALPPEQEGDLQKIAVRIDASVPGNRLLDLLYQIETTTPYLLAESIELRGAGAATARNGRARGPVPLTMRADLHVYLRPAIE